MGKVLTIKDADFSNNAVCKIHYVNDGVEINTDNYSFFQGNLYGKEILSESTINLTRMSIQPAFTKGNNTSVKITLDDGYLFAINQVDSDKADVANSGWISGGSIVSLLDTCNTYYVIFKKSDESNFEISEVPNMNGIIYFNHK